MYIKRVKILIEPEAKENVVEAINCGELVYGDSLIKLNYELKRIFKKKYCLLTSNGFSSIFLSLKALGLDGKKILIPAISSCFSFVNAIKASGNIPVYCDVEESSGNICILSAKSIFKNKGFDAIVSPNHIGVISCIEKLTEFCVPIIEDCAQSFLSSSEVISNSTFQVFSFYPTKIANGIDGGAILTNDKKKYEILKNILYYDHQYNEDDFIRYNFKMQNINAAFLLGTLKYIDLYKKKICSIVKRYNNLLQSVNEIETLSSNTNYLFKYMIKFNKADNYSLFIKEFENYGVSKEFNFLTNEVFEFKNSKTLVSNTCSLPLYPSLTNEEIKLITNKIIEMYGIKKSED